MYIKIFKCKSRFILRSVLYYLKRFITNIIIGWSCLVYKNERYWKSFASLKLKKNWFTNKNVLVYAKSKTYNRRSHDYYH